MDPPSLVSQVPVPEMWQFPTVGAPPSGPTIGRMAPGPEVAAVGNRDASLDESTVTERAERQEAGEEEAEKRKYTSTEYYFITLYIYIYTYIHDMVRS
ncbi:putative transcription factor bHLH79-like [Cocos nucifera]|uniref:Putative transcription factor bHLH79-like n=1 Tax=Cocos nucifera TaxID=13894 RepID=A0A8K0N0J3_COCNU|nr:putative transcription factor bHLH79-like [Cocos nucifera]